jgi:hypothetical protein
MQYCNLGSTGIMFSSLWPGAMLFGARGNAGHDDSFNIIDGERVLARACGRSRGPTKSATDPAGSVLQR